MAQDSSVPRGSNPFNQEAARALGKWRERLLDLSQRNPLLHFWRSRGTKIRIAHPELDQLYQALVLREKRLTFPKPTDQLLQLAEFGSSDDLTDGRDLRESPGDIRVDYATGSARDVIALQQKLRRLRDNARVALEEEGVNTLYVALGLLQWREPESAETEVAPLVLVPASIHHKLGQAYELSCYEPDPRSNPVLAYWLKQSFALSLPDFEPYSGISDGHFDLDGYFESVRSATAPLGWQVLEEAWVAHFSFEKLVMYDDLGQPGTEVAIAEHPVLGALVQAREYERRPLPAEISDPATAYDRHDLFPVLDADLSQLEVLAQARAGNSLAVEGPPGTGKSQTITNLIADAIRSGKTVLFVSEKRAALEVVRRRLQECGLDRLCLELHSHRTGRGSLAEEVNAALEGCLEAAPSPQVNAFRRRSALRKQLDEYVSELHRPRGAAGLTAFKVHGDLAKLALVPSIDAEMPSSALDIDGDQEQRMLERLRAIQETGVWDREADHPWRGAAPTQPLVLVRRALEASLRQLIDGLAELLRSQDEAKDALGDFVTARSVEDLGQVLDRLSVLANPPSPVRSALRARRDGNPMRPEEICSMLLELGADGRLLTDYRLRYSRWWRRLGPGYWKASRRVRASVGRRLPWREALAVLTAAQAYGDVLRSVAEGGDSAAEGVGNPASTGLSDGGNVTVSVLVWVGMSVLDHGTSRLPADVVLELVRRPGAVVSAAHELLERLKAIQGKIQASLEELSKLFPDGLDGIHLNSMALADLRDRAVTCQQNLASYDEWRNYWNAIQKAAEEGLRPFLKAARDRRIAGEHLEKAFLRALRQHWLQEVYSESPILRDFDRANHERQVREFAQLDRSLVKQARDLVLQVAYERQEPVRIAAGYLSESGRPSRGRPGQDEGIPELKKQIGLLCREVAKKRRRLPIRRMLPEIADLVSLLKPCLLMSPLSVATYLPRGRFRFDLVIFDEASQVLPEDAVGAILRAQQAVIFGDSKQLPPTPFFRRVLDDGSEDADEGEVGGDVEGFESILDLAKGALPKRSLRWHYRSKDERLIAFSNERFYRESPLITFPGPDLSADSTGVRLIVARDGRWETGSKRNLPEARRVVDLVREHLQQRPERSLGVIALGLSQAEAIDMELQRTLVGSPELAERLEGQGREPFFVKNLENVQGDERDEIILSIGYGPLTPGGPVPLRFGPINQEGGERRLNVAITRARYRTTVVSSFDPEALLRAPEALRRPGPRYLQEYLLYAKRQGRPAVSPNVDPRRLPESEFEEAVREALEACGYQVDAQVGQSGYRIDLAVRDPDRPDRYVLAIECDGATYHSSLAARDRDRLRQEQLEALGWRFHRIWSTDWIRNQGSALERVIQAIEKARRARAGELAGPPPTGAQQAWSGREQGAMVAAAEPRRTPGWSPASDKQPDTGDEEPEETERAPSLMPAPLELPVLRSESRRSPPSLLRGEPSSLSRPLPDPRQAPAKEVREALRSLIEEEGPLNMRLLLRLYVERCPSLQRAGRIVAGQLKRALWELRRSREVVIEDELGDRSLESQVVRLVGTPAVVKRPRRDRDLFEIPPSELSLVMARLAGPSAMEEVVFRALLQHYGFTRLTTARRKHLAMVRRIKPHIRGTNT